MTRRARNASQNAGRKYGKSRAQRFAARQRGQKKKHRRRIAKASRARNLRASR